MTTNIKITENFNTKKGMNSIRHKRGCWSNCYGCGVIWAKIETSSIHMVNLQDPKEYVKGNGTYFICDSCLTDHKTNIQ